MFGIEATLYFVESYQRQVPWNWLVAANLILLMLIVIKLVNRRANLSRLVDGAILGLVFSLVLPLAVFVIRQF